MASRKKILLFLFVLLFTSDDKFEKKNSISSIEQKLSNKTRIIRLYVASTCHFSSLLNLKCCFKFLLFSFDFVSYFKLCHTRKQNVYFTLLLCFLLFRFYLFFLRFWGSYVLFFATWMRNLINYFIRSGTNFI